MLICLSTLGTKMLIFTVINPTLVPNLKMCNPWGGILTLLFINVQYLEGRQRTKFTDGLKKFVVNHNISTTTDLVRKTEDREDWRSMVAEACYSGPGS